MVGFLARVHITISAYTRISEVVLIFEIVTIGHAEDLKSHEVLLSSLDITADVKLCLELVILAIAHKLAIDPEIHRTRHRTEMHNHLIALPVGRNHDLAAIIAHMILLERHEWRHARNLAIARSTTHLIDLVAETAVPDESSSHIDRVAKAIELPASWHRYGLPVSCAVTRLIESINESLGIRLEIEIPCAVDRDETLRRFLAALCCLSGLECKMMGVHRHAVVLVDVGILPRLGNCRRHPRNSWHILDRLWHLKQHLDMAFVGTIPRFLSIDCRSRTNC